MKFTQIAITLVLTFAFALSTSNAFAGYGKYSSAGYGKYSSAEYGKYSSAGYGKYNKRADRIGYKFNRSFSKPSKHKKHASKRFYKSYFVVRSFAWWKMCHGEVGGPKPSPS